MKKTDNIFQNSERFFVKLFAGGIYDFFLLQQMQYMQKSSEMAG